MYGLVRGGAAEWELECTATEPAAGVDLKGPSSREIPAGDSSLSWGVVGAVGQFDMFRRAKVMVDGVLPLIERSVEA